ncbi:hypothetical protein J7J23_02065 [bacterium]|nr:hypothetical protein [bacterium]
MEDEVKNLLIRNLNVAARIKGIMAKYGVRTLGELSAYTPKELFKISGGSRKFIEEVEMILKKHGLSLKEYKNKYGGF